jgi:hypothetical protein
MLWLNGLEIIGMASIMSHLPIFWLCSDIKQISYNSDKRIPQQDVFKVRSAYNREKLDKICKQARVSLLSTFAI